MNNGWTGGQYSLFRGIFGVYLIVHFAALLPWGTEIFSNTGILPVAGDSPLIHAFPNLLAFSDSPMTVTVLLVSAVLSCVLFAIGKGDRFAAIWIWYVLACLFGRNPMTANPSLPFVGWMLLAHAFLPFAPYGSLAAKGRIDPDNGWIFDRRIFLAAWIVMSLAYTYSGYTKLLSPSWIDGSALSDVLQNPLARDTPLRLLVLSLPPIFLSLATWGGLALELGFAILALSRWSRPWIWLSMLILHLTLIVLIDFADLSLGMVMLHLFTFDPAWLPGRKEPGSDALKLFYDGHCGLCHRSVRFFLAEDHLQQIQFAPLHGDSFSRSIPAATRMELPDSLVVQTTDGRLLTRSVAVFHLLCSLGGYWRILGTLLEMLPTFLCDSGYALIAKWRHRIFGRPAEACPLMPPRLRERFRA
jgi:predicted DCC family thiol-disulfide oxidoreductase YuxK